MPENQVSKISNTSRNPRIAAPGSYSVEGNREEPTKIESRTMFIPSYPDGPSPMMEVDVSSVFVPPDPSHPMHGQSAPYDQYRLLGNGQYNAYASSPSHAYDRRIDMGHQQLSVATNYSQNVFQARPSKSVAEKEEGDGDSLDGDENRRFNANKLTEGSSVNSYYHWVPPVQPFPNPSNNFSTLRPFPLAPPPPTHPLNPYGPTAQELADHNTFGPHNLWLHPSDNEWNEMLRGPGPYPRGVAFHRGQPLWAPESPIIWGGRTGRNPINSYYFGEDDVAPYGYPDPNGEHEPSGRDEWEDRVDELTGRRAHVVPERKQPQQRYEAEKKLRRKRENESQDTRC